MCRRSRGRTNSRTRSSSLVPRPHGFRRLAARQPHGPPTGRAARHPVALGASGDPRDAYTIGAAAAVEGRAVGIHVNFAPDADVNNNPANPIINTRSFGEDPRTVSRLVAAYVRGLHEHGMLATLKHFP